MPLAGSEDAVPKGEPYERAATQSTERNKTISGTIIANPSAPIAACGVILSAARADTSVVVRSFSEARSCMTIRPPVHRAALTAEIAMRNASDGSHILGTLSFVCYISWASFLVRSGIRVFIATRERSKLFMPAMNTEPIVTPFGFTSTADDVIRGVDLAGKRAIVTGGASGIGIETARGLRARAPKSP